MSQTANNEQLYYNIAMTMRGLVEGAVERRKGWALKERRAGLSEREESLRKPGGGACER